jgi:hypothetical protein
MAVGIRKGVAATGRYVANAVNFDDSTYISRGADLDGNTDSDKFTFSCWVKTPASIPNGAYIYHNEFTTGNNRFLITVNSSGNVQIETSNSGGTIILSGAGATDIRNAWYNILIDADLSGTPTFNMYLNDSLELDEGTTASISVGTIEFTRPDHAMNRILFTASPTTTDGYDIADPYLNIGTKIGFQTESNRRKFISASGNPIGLGETGTIPTGSQPIVYFSKRKGESASDFATNKGSGGDFSITGTLTTAATSPSD